MGNKRSHIQNSMSHLVSRAALTKLGPDIEEMVTDKIKSLGSQLAKHQASTTETLFSRIVILEKIIMERFGLTTQDLANKVADQEDEREGLKAVDNVGPGDVVRLLIKTKTKDQDQFQGESRIKMYSAGSGNSLGSDLEGQIIGMNVGETKTILFGEDQEMVAEVYVNRVSRGGLVNAAAEAQG